MRRRALQLAAGLGLLVASLSFSPLDDPCEECRIRCASIPQATEQCVAECCGTFS